MLGARAALHMSRREGGGEKANWVRTRDRLGCFLQDPGVTGHSRAPPAPGPSRGNTISAAVLQKVTETWRVGLPL